MLVADISLRIEGVTMRVRLDLRSERDEECRNMGWKLEWSAIAQGDRFIQVRVGVYGVRKEERLKLSTEVKG